MSVAIVQTNEKDLTKFAFALQQLAQGRSNAVGQVTLRAGQTTTTVNNQTCGPESIVLLMPKTACAAAALATTHVSATAPGTFTLTHTNAASSDRTFGYVNVG
jgi:hypothetical protein